jgi:hypothetical protein
MVIRRFATATLLAVLCGSPSLATQGGPDAFGYYFVDHLEPQGPAFAWENISLTGTAAATVNGCDDCLQPGVPIGFNFDFYGVTHSTLTISSNGYVGFGAQASSGCCTGLPMPGTGTPNDIIAIWWEDLDPVSGGSIYYQTLGTPPDQRMIVSFQGIHHYPTGTPVDVQLKLFERNSTIEIHLQNPASDGGDHSVGIEDATGNVGIGYYNGPAALQASTAVRFYTCTTTDDDGDGVTMCDGDCDDEDPTILPGAADACDSIDSNCDGSDGIDADLDAFGDCGADGIPGTGDEDCDDSDPSINPNAT